MTPTAPTLPAPPPRRRRPPLVQWAADLALGVRLSVSGGRAGAVRLALVAIGIGLGAAVLLGAATVPAVVAAQQARVDDRAVPTWVSDDALAAGPGTLLTSVVRSHFRDLEISGLVVQAEGDAAPTPPGVTRLPGPGEVVPSPALAELLASRDAEALQGRWGDEVIGTIGPAGLTRPGELTFYLGSDELADDERAVRVDRFGGPQPSGGEPDPLLLLLAAVGTVVLLLPVAVFVSTAVRFGSEARDRRLAALRLVGADARATRRIAAGETLAGAVLGLAVGGLLHGVLLALLPRVLTGGASVFPGDLRPVPALVALVVVLLPVAAVLVTTAAMERVVVEPLGVVRRSGDRRRRLWWRLVPPVLGVALLGPLVLGGGAGTLSEDQRVLAPMGLALLLGGVALLLPWVVEAVVRRLRGAGLPGQLAVRRLQLDSGTSVRAVSGITVSIAGLIAVNGLVAGFEALAVGDRDLRDSTTFQAAVYADDDPRWGTLADAPGVLATSSTTTVRTSDPATGQEVLVTIGECAALAVDTEVGDCADGDVFAAAPTGGTAPVAGTTYSLGGAGSATAPRWTVPASVQTVPAESGQLVAGQVLPARLLVTPGALAGVRPQDPSVELLLALDPTSPDALDHVRTAAAQVDPTAYVTAVELRSLAPLLADVRQVLLAGTAALLVLVGASLLVNVVEQQRERRHLLAALVAVGVRRRTLSASVLLQVAVPMALGLVLAVITGTGLAAALLVGIEAPVVLDWTGIGTTSAVAAAVVLATTAASLPLLWRLARPEGLRTE